MSQRIISEVGNHQLVKYCENLYITLSPEDMDKLDNKYKKNTYLKDWIKEKRTLIVDMQDGGIKNFCCRDTEVETYPNNCYQIVDESKENITVSLIALEIIKILNIEFKIIAMSAGGGGGYGGGHSYGIGDEVKKPEVKKPKVKEPTIMEKFIADRLNTNKKRLSDDILESTKERIKIESERNNNLKRMAELEKDLREKVPESLHDDRVREYYKLIGAEHKLPAIESREKPITRRTDEEPKMEDIKTEATPPKNREGLPISYSNYMGPMIKYNKFPIIPTVS